MTTRFSRIALFGRALALGCCLAVTAHADPSPADVDSAKTLYVEGLELRDKGDLAASLTRFRDAHALAATPITTLELGRALGLTGHLVEARETLLSVDRLPARPDESQKAVNARAEARALAEQLRVKIPSVRFQFPPKMVGTPRVSIDGAAVPPEALATARKVDPGKHTVIAELGDDRAVVEVTLAERDNRTLSFNLGAGGASATTVVEPQTPAPAPAPEAPPPDKPPTPAPRTGGQSGIFWAGVATGGLGLVAGSITGIIAFSKSNPEGCSAAHHCLPSAESDINLSKTMGNVSTVAFIVAGVGAVVAIIAYAARGDSSVQPTARELRWSWP